jgi:hypothetical protein
MKKAMRGRWALVAVALTLTACSDQASNRALGFLTGSYWQKPEAINPTFLALKEAGAPRKTISIQAQNLAANFHLWTVSEDGVETWLTGNGATVSIKDGMIVGTRGFGADVLAADVSKTARLVQARGEGYAVRFMTLLSGNDQAEIHSYQCLISNQGPWDLDLGDGTQKKTVLMQEDCRGYGQDARNLFWLNARTNEIVQSRQWLNPTVGALVTRDEN